MKRKVFIFKLILLAFLLIGCKEEKDTAVRAIDSNSEKISGDGGGIDAGGADGGGLDSGGFDGGNDTGGTDGGSADSGGTDSGGTDGGSTERVDYIETFNQKNLSGDDVTIIFSIDNSGSMAGEQLELVNSLSQFNDTLVQSNMNFRILVTTSNLAYAGKLTHDENDLTRAAYEANPAKFEEDIDSAMFIGACPYNNARFCEKGFYNGTELGPDSEFPIIASREILEKYTTAPNKIISDTERVIVVFISDEADISLYKGNSMTGTINSFYNFVEPSRIHFYNIYDFLCGRIYSAEVCTQYNSLGNMENGTIADLNQPFNNVLDQIANKAVSLQKVFVLKSVPTSYTRLVVRVNKLELSPNQYIFNGKSITLTDPSTLISGSRITAVFEEGKVVQSTGGGNGPNDTPIE